MSGKGTFLSSAIIGSLLISGVAVATKLDNRDQPVKVDLTASSEIVAHPYAAPLYLAAPPTTTPPVTTPSQVAHVAPSVSSRYMAAGAVTTTPTTAIKASQDAPSPPIETVSASDPSGDDCMGWLSYVEMRGLPVDTFCGDSDNPGIIWCESRGNPNAQNGQHAGLTQLAQQYHEGRANKLGYTWSDMHDGSANLHVASDLYNESGLSPWYPSQYCWG